MNNGSWLRNLVINSYSCRQMMRLRCFKKIHSNFVCSVFCTRCNAFQTVHKIKHSVLLCCSTLFKDQSAAKRFKCKWILLPPQNKQLNWSLCQRSLCSMLLHVRRRTHRAKCCSHPLPSKSVSGQWGRPWPLSHQAPCPCRTYIHLLPDCDQPELQEKLLSRISF